VLVCALATGACITSAAALAASRLTRNYTPSLPLGVYWLRPRLAVTRGTLVDFAIPGAGRRLIADRYLPARFHLLKRVVALQGDVVCMADGRFLVNGVSISAIAAHDSVGRPLPTFEFCGPVDAGTAFVATPIPSSLDSRYFGPVPVSALTVAIPLWTS
jgi:conjugative transfer signal peptidase TraF